MVVVLLVLMLMFSQPRNLDCAVLDLRGNGYRNVGQPFSSLTPVSSAMYGAPFVDSGFGSSFSGLGGGFGSYASGGGGGGAAGLKPLSAHAGLFNGAATPLGARAAIQPQNGYQPVSSTSTSSLHLHSTLAPL